MTKTPAEHPPKRGLIGRRLLVAALATVLLAVVTWVWYWLARTEFPLEEIPTPASEEFHSGPSAACVKTPSKDVARYALFASSAPLFGGVDLDPNASGGKGLVPYHFALDESKGTGAGYDTLYFDVNANLDLTDDKPLKGQPGPPGLLATFDHMVVPWNYGPDMPSRTVEFIPGLRSDTRRDTRWLIFAYTSVRRGEIRIGRRAYSVTLIRGGSINGRYDNPDLKSMLYAVRPARICLFKHHRFFTVHAPADEVFPLIQMPHVGGKWYRFSTTPLGGVLSVKPYDGDTGVLRIGSGDSPVRLAALGCILNRDTFIRLEETDDCGNTPWVEQRDIPVGDYDVRLLIVKAGLLHVNLQHNRDSDGIPNDRDNHPPRYFIEIRKDKTFTFELPETLNVLFAAPAKDQRFKPGDTVTVKSALLDPVHDLRITGIDDYRNKALGAALNAEIVIKDGSGGAVSQGRAPISDIIYYGFSWQIPANFLPKGGQERLTITVTYDTLDLYGKIESSREIIVEK